MTGAKEFPNITASFTPMMEAFSPKKKDAPAEAGGGLTVKAVFDGMAGAFQADKASGVDVVFQYDISGPSGGSWTVTIKDGTCEVTEGSHSSPTTTLKMGDEDFVKMISGELNAMNAYTSGKLKIEGDVMKSQLIEKLFKM
jgi:putative sterol carrier protein